MHSALRWETKGEHDVSGWTGELLQWRVDNVWIWFNAWTQTHTVKKQDYKLETISSSPALNDIKKSNSLHLDRIFLWQAEKWDFETGTITIAAACLQHLRVSNNIWSPLCCVQIICQCSLVWWTCRIIILLYQYNHKGTCKDISGNSKQYRPHATLNRWDLSEFRIYRITRFIYIKHTKPSP